MGFTESVRSVFSKYATFSGRAPRSEYWWFVLFCLIANIVLGIVDRALFGWTTYEPQVLSTVFSVATLLPSLAVGARRLHDIDRTAWWLLLGFVPVIGWIVLIVFAATKGTSSANRFGPDPLGGDDAGSIPTHSL